MAPAENDWALMRYAPTSEAHRHAEQALTLAAAEFEHAHPPKYRGLERAAHVGRIIAEDVRAGHWPLEVTLRDVIQANAVTFDPPYSDAKLQALARAELEHLEVDANGR